MPKEVVIKEINNIPVTNDLGEVEMSQMTIELDAFTALDIIMDQMGSADSKSPYPFELLDCKTLLKTILIPGYFSNLTFKE
jgi:hypothetical protein